MNQQDPVRGFLMKRGCPDHVVQGGLTGLVEAWEDVALSVAQGYGLGLDDYLNDVDGRQLLEEALVLASADEKKAVLQRVRRADRAMKALVRPSKRCLWGNETAQERRWTAERNWWYFSVPREAGPDLLSEIEHI